jgi:hypothetical protein
MPRPLHFTRSHAILRIRRRLEQDAFPRIQMGLIVGLTGAAGLLFSFLMLDAGITSMALRYPLALLAAYGFFLFLLWLWLRTKADDYVEIPDLSGLVPSGPGEGSSAIGGGGGNFGGGGASGSFDGPASLMPFEPDSASPLEEAASAVSDADELAIPLIVAACALGLALASLYVVYAAPILFAELLVDGALSYALYSKIKGAESPHWLGSAIRRTALPFLLTGGFVAIAGAAMAAYAPGAHSIGQVIQQTQVSR